MTVYVVYSPAYQEVTDENSNRLAVPDGVQVTLEVNEAPVVTVTPDGDVLIWEQPVQ